MKELSQNKMAVYMRDRTKAKKEGLTVMQWRKLHSGQENGAGEYPHSQAAEKSPDSVATQAGNNGN